MNFCSQCKHSLFWKSLYVPRIPMPLHFDPICHSPAYKDKRDIVSGQWPDCSDVKEPNCENFEKIIPKEKKIQAGFWKRLFG